MGPLLPVEPMHHYITRRIRAWRVLRRLDDKISLSDEVLADMLLDNAGITQDEKTCITSSIQNSRDFDKISEALRKQHHRAHHRDRKREDKKASGKGAHKGGGRGYSKPYYKHGSNQKMVMKK